MDRNDKRSSFSKAAGPPEFWITEKLLKKEGLLLYRILDQISTGIIILSYKSRTILFTNDYYNSIFPSQKKDEILRNIFKHLEANVNFQKHFDINQDMLVTIKGKESLLSCTIYRISDNIFVVFLDEVTSGTMYFLTKQENEYYIKLSDLLAEMVHEIGNPLAGINTSLQVLLNNISTWPLEKVKDYVERTIHEINRLSDFLIKMREVSDENRLLEIKPVQLKNVIDNVLLRNEALLKQKGIVCKNAIQGDIMVSIDEGAFYQIILNLLNNSLRILPPGKTIDIYLQDIDEYYVKLIFRNDGEPIPEEIIEKIFLPLFSTRSKQKGIGLAISLKLLTRMGGTIKAVQPEDGVGAKFVLFIPSYTKPNGLENPRRP